jgi:hypothetical protein
MIRFFKGIALTKRAMIREEELNDGINWNEDAKQALQGIVMGMRNGVSGRGAKSAQKKMRQWRCRLRCTMLRALSIVPVKVNEVQKFVAPLPLAHKYRHYRMHHVFDIEECQSIRLRENDSWKLMWQRQGYRVLSILLDCMVHSIDDADRLSRFFYSSYSFLHFGASLKKNICHTKIWSIKTVCCVADFVGVLQEYLVSIPAFEHLQCEVKNKTQTVTEQLRKALDYHDVKRTALRAQAIQVSPFISAWWTYELLFKIGLYPNIHYVSWELEGLDSRSEPPDNKTSVYFLTEQILAINRDGELKSYTKTLRRSLQELLLVPMLESLRAETEEEQFPTSFEAFTKHDNLKSKLVSCYLNYVKRIDSPGAQVIMKFYKPLGYDADDNCTAIGALNSGVPNVLPEPASVILENKSTSSQGIKRRRGLHRNLKSTTKTKRVKKPQIQIQEESETTDTEEDSDDEPIAQKLAKPTKKRKSSTNDLEDDSDDEPIAHSITKLRENGESETSDSEDDSDDEPLARKITKPTENGESETSDSEDNSDDEPIAQKIAKLTKNKESNPEPETARREPDITQNDGNGVPIAQNMAEAADSNTSDSVHYAVGQEYDHSEYDSDDEPIAQRIAKAPENYVSDSVHEATSQESDKVVDGDNEVPITQKIVGAAADKQESAQANIQPNEGKLDAESVGHSNVAHLDKTAEIAETELEQTTVPLAPHLRAEKETAFTKTKSGQMNKRIIDLEKESIEQHMRLRIVVLKIQVHYLQAKCRMLKR